MHCLRLAACVGLLVVVSATGGCEPSAASNRPPAPGDVSAEATSKPLVETVVAGSRSHVEKVDLPAATVEGFETTQLMAKLGGFVKEIASIDGSEIDIGVVVKQGDSLALLDVPEMLDELRQKQALVDEAVSQVGQAEAAIEQAKAELEKSQAEVRQAEAMQDEKAAQFRFRQAAHRRISRLVEDKAVGEENLDESKFALDAAESSLSSVDAEIATARASVKVAEQHVAKADLDKRRAEARVRVAEAEAQRMQTLTRYAEIRAPFDGVITRRFVDHGAFVRPATSNSGAMPMFEITRTDKVRVVISSPTVSTTLFGVGQRATLHNIGGLPGVEVEGAVSRVSAALDQNTRMMRFEMHLENPVPGRSQGETVTLKPGMFGTVSVVIKEWDELAVVPSTALGRTATGQHYVMVVESGTVHRRPVTVVFDDARDVGIGTGIHPGDTVVAAGIGDLQDGQQVASESP